MHQNVSVRQKGYDHRYNTWHTLSRNMILFVHAGDGSIISRERNYPLVSGSLCFVGSDKFYYTLPEHPEAYVRSKLFLSNRELDAVLALFPEDLKMGERFSKESIVYAKIDGENAARIEKMFDELKHSPEETCYREALAAAAFIRLIVDISSNAADMVSFSSGIVQKAAEYINSHIEDVLTIDEICRAAAVSKYHLCRKFKQATGLTVMEYVLKTRIITAKHLLENEMLTVGEISEKCGFASQSYFGKVFKQEFGVTPLRYRKEKLQP